ncbi:MAG TPA: glycosyltransferase family 39 protein [Ktedonobacterales bacterium]|nr:glycosyltransferase family 39 protein [Ktedonobacterales bacterium]
MSATELHREGSQASTPLWRDRERRADLLRRHGALAGVAVVVGAILRLLWLGDTSFLGDQAQLLALGRSAAEHHALIITGIPSSIGTLNPPLSTWLYAPFALVTGPLGATVFTALVNIVACALIYAIAARYVNRWAGFAAALLYATASGPVHYARFVWQQNLLAPVVLLLFWMILRAVVERARGWLGWSVLLWAAATELHPTAAPLLGLIVVAAALTWRDLRRRDLAWAALALAVLFGPTALWELVSHGYDLQGAQRLGGRAIFDTWALTYLSDLIQPAPATAYGATSTYVAVGRGVAFLGALLEALVIAGQLWLVGTLAAPWLRSRDARGGLRLALDDARWRVALSLALWEALPLAFMLRHSRPIEPHYLLVLLPADYLIVGAALAWAADWLRDTLTRRGYARTLAQRGALAALVVVVGAVSLTQTIGVVGELATIHSGQFDALTLPLHYGTPLASERAALDAAQAAARRGHATVTIASTRVQQEPIGYLNATNANAIPATDYISDGCVTLPAADARRPMVMLALPGTTAAQLLPSMRGAHALGEVSVQGGPPYLLYGVQPGATLAGEHVIVPASVGSQPRVAAGAILSLPGGGSTLAIRWTGAPKLLAHPASGVSYWYGATPNATPIADYTFTVQGLDLQGKPVGAPLTATCARLAWSSGVDVVSVMRWPASLVKSGRVASWHVMARIAPAVVDRPALGPLALETGAITFGPGEPLGQPETIAAP